VNHPSLLLVLAACVFVYTGWFPVIFSDIAILPGLIVGSLVSGWALLMRPKRPDTRFSDSPFW